MKRFVAWDGEGVTVNGVHRYVLLMNSQGAILVNPAGITTREALRFFLAHADRTATHLIFVGTYDANMLLGDLEPTRIRELWWTGRSFYAPPTRNKHDHQFFTIRYRPRREFFVKDNSPARWKSPTHGQHVRLWDVFGFFQSSFVKGCETWLGKEDPRLALVRTMKERRSQFTLAELPAMQEYCALELSLLVSLANVLCEACDASGYPPRRWDGAGAIATAMLRAHSVQKHVGTRPVNEVLEPLACAFSGGRIETTGVGFVGECWIYDLHSAYPHAMRRLPSFTGAFWYHGDDGTPYTLHEISWDLPLEQAWYPLFYRGGDGAIAFPPSGRGWFWSFEKVLLDVWIRHRGGGGRATEHDAWTVRPWSTIRPFAFMETVYEQRLAAESANCDGVARVLKLGMNSVFGKTCQGVGWDPENGGPPREPPFFNLAWAGMTTSMTRLRLGLAALSLDPWDVVQFATDALFTRRRLKVETIGPNLGEFAERYVYDLTIAQSGVYWYREAPEGPWVHRSRGYDLATMRDPQFLFEAWKRGERMVEVPSTRFVSMGTCVQADSLLRDYWRSWQTIGRPLRTDGGSAKRSAIDPSVNLADATADFLRTGPAPVLDWHHLGLPSAAYNIKAWPLARRARKPEEEEEEALRDCDDEAFA